MRRRGGGIGSLLLRMAGVLLLLVAIAAGVLVAQDWRLWQRYLNSPDDPVAATDWFEPTVEIGTGEGAPLKVAAENERTVAAAALDAALAYAKEKNSYGLIVAHKGAVQLEYYKDGFNSTRLLDSQSLHKPLVGILTMAAVADGKLGLDDPLGKFIPAWANDARAKITVRDVLYMQTGLSEPRYEESVWNEAYRAFLTSKLDDAILKLAVEEEPGAHFKSHYMATQLLQLVLEKATGRTYADYLRERLWSRLGGGHARVRLDRPGGNAQVFCCLQARPRDWLRVGLMLAQNGAYNGQTILPLETLLQLLTPSTMGPNFAMQQIWLGSPYTKVRMSDSKNPARGLPVSEPFAAADAFYLEGRGGQRVYVVPSRELVVVRQGEVRMEWDDAKFLNGILAGLPPVPPPGETPTAIGRGLQPPGFAFSALLAPKAPDYAKPESWAARPETNDAADATPPGLLPAQPGPPKIAAFYINPTTYYGNANWNAAVDDPAVNASVDAVVKGQGSALNFCCDVYAPRYRQAGIAALASGMQPYDLAYLDVRAAFTQFLKEIGARPFIVLGHSQGALHTQRLVTETIDKDAALSARLVAAYVVGIPMPQALYGTSLKTIKPCTSATQTNCVATWATFSPAYANLDRWRAGARARYAAAMQAANTNAIQCVNPLNWTADETAAPPQANLGASLVNPADGQLTSTVPALVGAQCRDGALVVTPEPPLPFAALAFEPGNYHLADVALFYANLRANAAERARAWCTANAGRC
jgi:CubicO group peptidase (beta-lactamase class C family)/pimeloyl-ACP methyl ester carboxylesterase